jgi:hypothetical protein
MNSQVTLPGGLEVVTEWIQELFGPTPGLRLWSALDNPLRLALAQGWVLNTQGQPEQSRAEALAQLNSTDSEFDVMFSALVEHWQGVYSTLQHGSGVLGRINPVGIDLEAVVLTSPEYIGDYRGPAAIPAHSFIARLSDNRVWTIAALARRLPVPGWPPTEQTIPDFEE